MTEAATFPPSGPNYYFVERAGSKRLVIFFSGTGQRNGRFEFWKAGREVEENLLFVSDGRNHWYQDGVAGLGTTIEETIASIQAWCARNSVDEIITVGASMGGYGAVLYGGMLKAKVLAFSFDTLLRLPTSPSWRLMPKDAVMRYPDLVPAIQQAGAPINVFVGEMYPIDVVAAQRLVNLPNVKVESLRGVDHGSARFLHLALGVKTVVGMIATGTPIPRLPERGSICESPELVGLLHRAHVAFFEKDLAACLKLCRQGLRIAPRSEIFHYLLGRAYLSLKRMSAAIKHLEFAASRSPEFEDGQFFHAQALRIAKYNKQAIPLFEQQIGKWPNAARLPFNLAISYERVGRNADALEQMSRAVSLQPSYEAKEADMRERIEKRGGIDGGPRGGEGIRGYIASLIS
jgi:tetratricopeptide (TPR) repeat protein